MFFLGVGAALVQSLGYIPAFGMTDITLQYYGQVLRDSAISASIKASLIIALVSAIIATLLGVLICAALVLRGKANSKIVAVVKTPILVPHTIVALFAIMLFSQSGLLARILFACGIIQGAEDFPSFLYTPDHIGIIMAYVWKEAPFIAYFVLALMASINTKWGEAAQNLGASGLRAFFHVTLPLCLPTINKAFLIIFAFAFGAYELPYLLGATMPKALPVQAYIEYINPDLRHRAYAMALNGIMLLLTLAIAAVYYLLSKKRLNLGGERHE